MTDRTLFVNLNSDSDQVMIKWPNGQVQFETIGPFISYIKMLWWLVRLRFDAYKSGYDVKVIVDNEEV